MTSTRADLVPIECLAGVQPAPDSTAFATDHFTYAEKIRFVEDVPEKIGGWEQFNFNNDATIDGTSRSIYSQSINGRVYTTIGTNSKLYSVIGSELTNITPLSTSTATVANSLATHYATLANNPVTTVNGSKTIVIADTEAALFEIGDTYKLSGASTTNGVPDTQINAAHVVRAIGVNTISVRVSTAASSSGSGGGASVVRSSGLITVTAAAHGMLDGDRVKITDAATTGGVLDTQINQQFLIRNVVAGAFDIMTAGTASSSVSAGGGASTKYQKEIADGEVNASFGQGYGMGLYGVGLYGVSKLSTNTRVYPRIWFFDRFGDLIITTPGNQTGVYSWDGDTDIAPALVSGAPTAVNYAFVSNNILITFGASGVENRIKTSDQNALTTWSASSTNQVFEDDVEGAGRLLSHISVNGTNLIFTENQTYTFRYIGLPLIWDIELKEPNIGIIAPMARVSIQGTAYWMDDNNFYMWNGGDIVIIPSNSGPESTIHEWMFDDINYAQKSKTFAWYNPKFNEIWFHSLSADSNEPDKVARYNVVDKTWVTDYFDRTAGEYPNISLDNPRLMATNILYKHEIGTDADGEPMYWVVRSNLRSLGRYTTNVDGIIPDSIQQGDVNLNIKTRRFPQSVQNVQNSNFTITSTTERVPYTTNGGYWIYEWSGEELGQTWRMGKWQEYVQKGAIN